MITRLHGSYADVFIQDTATDYGTACQFTSLAYFSCSFKTERQEHLLYLIICFTPIKSAAVG